MVTSSKRTYATHGASHVCYSQSPCFHTKPLLTHASAGDPQILKVKSGSVSVGPLGPGVHTRYCLSPLSISGGYGFHSKCDFYWGFSLPLDVGYLLLVGYKILLSMAAQ